MNTTYRSQCACDCHSGLILCMFGCCLPDPLELTTTEPQFNIEGRGPVFVIPFERNPVDKVRPGMDVRLNARPCKVLTVDRIRPGLGAQWPKNIGIEVQWLD